MFAQGQREHDHAQGAAEKVARGAERTVVAALDDNAEDAAKVFHFVRLHFNTPGTRAVFAYVAAPLDPAQESPPEEAARVNQWVEKSLEMNLALQAQGLVLSGDPKEEFVLFCDHLQPDCLVVPTQHQGILGKLLPGSLPDYFVHKCKCTVVVVKA